MPNPTTPNGQRNPVTTTRTYVHELFAIFQGTGGNPTILDSGVNGGGEILSITKNSTGNYSVVFRKAWAQLQFAPTFSFIDAGGNAAGFDIQTSAMDVTQCTATFLTFNGNAASDIPTTTTVYVRWTVRSVSKN